ncbi:MAG: hypothetical protein JNK65_06425 [Deltaproteobacteria bacterium]|nr:hypothetical protein [Deltaproteobacteria bacterium]
MATKINDSYLTGAAAAKAHNVDPKVVDQAMKKMGADLLAQLGPHYLAYLRTVSENLSVLTSRDWESQVKSLPAQAESPEGYKDQHFMKFDTSKLPMYEYRLPDQFLNPETLDLAAKRGLLTQHQADAIKVFFGTHPEMQEKPQTQTQTMSFQSGKGERDSTHDEQQQGQSEQEAWEEWNQQIGGVSGNAGGRASITGPGGAPATGTASGGQVSNGGLPPPPPPPRPSSGGGDALQNKMQSQMNVENNYLNANFQQGDPYYGWFQTLFGSENWYRNFAGNAMGQIQKIKSTKQQILAELARINPNSPEGQMKMRMLQEKLSTAQGDERQLYDHIATAQKANNERKELIKNILDIFFQTNSAIIRNMKQ